MDKKWIVVFSAGSVAVAALLGLAVWMIAGSVPGPALNLNGLAAMAIGLVLTTGLGVGLMALVFYSARSGADDLGPAIPAQRPPGVEPAAPPAAWRGRR